MGPSCLTSSIWLQRVDCPPESADGQLSSCRRFHLEAVVRTQTMDNPKANLLQDSDGRSSG